MHQNRNRRWWGIKGQGGEAIQLFRRSKAKVDRTGKEIPLYIIGVDEAKLWLKRRLEQLEIGKGYAHFPLDRDAEYFEQLTAEKLVVKRKNGIEIGRVWEKTRVRNEALDCRVYSYIAVKILNPLFEKIQKNLVKLDSTESVKAYSGDEALSVKTIKSGQTEKASAKKTERESKTEDLHIKTFHSRRKSHSKRRKGGSIATNW